MESKVFRNVSIVADKHVTKVTLHLSMKGSMFYDRSLEQLDSLQIDFGGYFCSSKLHGNNVQSYFHFANLGALLCES